ncbi:MAG: THUMP domain-containing protein, partial [Bradymonadaceae bacterium]
MTALLLTTDGGLEDVAADEFRELADTEELAHGEIELKPFDLDGRVRIPTDEPADRLVPTARRMRSIHHVLRYVHTFEFDRDDPSQSIYGAVRDQPLEEVESASAFRVTSNRYGDHAFTSMDVQDWAGQAVVDAYGTDVDLENYDADVRVDVVADRCLIGIQYTRRALSKRHPRAFSPKVSLKTNVAFAMLRMARIPEHEPDVLLDPFCGAGTIPIEAAALHPELTVRASDWWNRAVDGARENAEAADVADRTTFAEVDARQLTDHYGE